MSEHTEHEQNEHEHEHEDRDINEHRNILDALWDHYRDGELAEPQREQFADALEHDADARALYETETGLLAKLRDVEVEVTATKHTFTRTVLDRWEADREATSGRRSFWRIGFAFSGVAAAAAAIALLVSAFNASPNPFETMGANTTIAGSAASMPSPVSELIKDASESFNDETAGLIGQLSRGNDLFDVEGWTRLVEQSAPSPQVEMQLELQLPSLPSLPALPLLKGGESTEESQAQIMRSPDRLA